MSHRRHSGEHGPEVTLPITPMLDMSFQLLFFFMATFNPTDPEGAQTLAMTREKIQKAEEQDKDKMAQDPKKVKDDVIHDKDKKEKKEEDLDRDTDLRLFIEPGGAGKQPITLKDGAIVVKTADKLDDKELLKFLATKLEERKTLAREEARKNKTTEDAEFAKQKVRVQPTVEVPWGEVFDAMNLCTRVGFKTVALTTPTGYLPKNAQPLPSP